MASSTHALGTLGTALVNAAMARAILLIFGPPPPWSPPDSSCFCTAPESATISVASLTVLSVGTLDGVERASLRPPGSQCRWRDELSTRAADLVVTYFPGLAFVDEQGSDAILLCARIGANGRVRPVQLLGDGSGDEATVDRAFAMLRGTRFRYLGRYENAAPVQALLLIRVRRSD